MFFKYLLFYITTINCLECIVSQNSHDVINNYANSSIRIKRKVRGDSPIRWQLIIPFYVDKNVDRNVIRESLHQLNMETCLMFREAMYMHPRISGIRYIYGHDCSSRIGKADGIQWQPISIGKDCDDIGRVQHETLHALGIDHEHNRIDRNNFLHIFRKNIKDDFQSDFFIVSYANSKTLNIPFDYGSLMHYDMYAYSKNDYMTILPKHELYRRTIGQMRNLTFNDIKTINLYYCAKRCRFQIKCYNGGYQNPNKCNTCKCVEGFTGRNCRLLVRSPLSCGRTFLSAEKFTQQIKAEGKNYCIYHIKAKKRRKIGLKIIFASIHPYALQICTIENTLEIKYWNDKTVTGARFCSLTPNTIFMSRSDHVIIYYRSNDIKNRFKLEFKKM
uniref:Metalloendopeptidase n=1 Tax=Strongyloides stercoralis TaxID=6248 RepID=A0A0K0EJM7_STRER